MENRAPQVDRSLIESVEWIGGQEILAFMSNGDVFEVTLPWVRSAETVRVIDEGMGLDLGDGTDCCADYVIDNGEKIFHVRPWNYERETLRGARP